MAPSYDELGLPEHGDGNLSAFANPQCSHCCGDGRIIYPFDDERVDYYAIPSTLFDVKICNCIRAASIKSIYGKHK
jgi:hypothetical protein